MGWMMDCETAAHWMSEGQDRPLSWRTRVSLRLHRWLCPPCDVLARQFDSLRAMLRAWAGRSSFGDAHPDPGGIPSEVATRIRLALAAAESGTSPLPSNDSEDP